MKIKDVLGSGALGLGTAALARNPELLRGFGVLGNVAANKLDDRDEEKKAAMGTMPTMKKGGKVKKMAKGGSASKRADGIAQRGKTRGKFI